MDSLRPGGEGSVTLKPLDAVPLPEHPVAVLESEHAD
jgi:hypothetical protein